MLSEENQYAAVRKSLVLLHQDSSQRPVGTIKWLNLREVERHYHLRWQRDEDFERLARFLTGNAIGLVFSGGGARGFAHIGVIRALQEAGITIDLIGGNSMGAIVSAEYLLGWDYETMLKRNRQLFKPLSIFDPTLPLVSLFSGRKRAKLMQREFGDVQIEDLWLPYFCVSSNLTRAELMIHRTGPLWKGVLASGTLAGIMPPVFHNGDLLVDGMLLNDMPIDVCYDLCDGGTVIAVNVSRPIDLQRNSDIGASLSGWRLLWNKINPFAKKLNFPHIATILQRAGELSSIYGRKELLDRNLADLYLEPAVEEVELFDFTSIDRIVKIGYDSTKEKIVAWQDGK
jgi:NTE family protein/lysophospholipid hydrolase